jgi:L-aspartate oxidase
VVERGPAAIRWLIEHGVPFTREDKGTEGSAYHLTREGGHSHRRIIHAADATGHAIETSLAETARAHSNVALFEEHIAIDLITTRKLGLPGNRCLGAYVLDLKHARVDVFRARCVVLATGGASKVYLYTSNPDTASGDGIAMAWRAGCRIVNMEFNQFHPTCLYHPHARSFLITEAVRGEGGHLVLPSGERFLDRYDPRAELAPRDIVARAIDHEMKRSGIDCVYLDISHKPADFIKEHFPTVYARCLALGLDMTREPLPVVPAAHYTCGGIATDLRGRADIPALYAIGETAHTGLHGANRMASNSLLECLVFAQAAGEDIMADLAQMPPPPEVPPWDESRVTDSDEEVVVSHNWDELRRFMWDYVGIVRTNKRLERAQRRAELLQREIYEYYSHFRVTNDLIELRNLVQVAMLIIRSAQLRRESRGLHFTLDYPTPDDSRPPTDTVLTPDANGRPSGLGWTGTN